MNERLFNTIVGMFINTYSPMGKSLLPNGTYVKYLDTFTQRSFNILEGEYLIFSGNVYMLN